MRKFAASVLVPLMLALPGLAHAQAIQCSVPDMLPRPRPDGPTRDQPARRVPIGHYTLAVTWSPQYCATASGARDSFQCGKGNRFGFTLHGLWPDGYGKDWPQYCKPATLLPRQVIRDHICATPSAQLIQHEWAKHGTCMSLAPAQFFARSRALYARIRFPDMAALGRRERLTAGSFASAFAAANPGLRADMMRITAARNGALEEVWLCLDTKFRYARCPAHQGGLSASAPVRIVR